MRCSKVRSSTGLDARCPHFSLPAAPCSPPCCCCCCCERLLHFPSSPSALRPASSGLSPSAHSSTPRTRHAALFCAAPAAARCNLGLVSFAPGAGRRLRLLNLLCRPRRRLRACLRRHRRLPRASGPAPRVVLHWRVRVSQTPSPFGVYSLLLARNGPPTIRPRYAFAVAVSGLVSLRHNEPLAAWAFLLVALLAATTGLIVQVCVTRVRCGKKREPKGHTRMMKSKA